MCLNYLFGSDLGVTSPCVSRGASGCYDTMMMVEDDTLWMVDGQVLYVTIMLYLSKMVVL